MRQHRNRTGGGPPSEKTLSDFDQKLIDVVSLTNLDGDTNLFEIGFESNGTN